MKKNILCVDDEQEIRELITELLETKSYRVVTAADGEDALEKMKHESFDLFLIDMSMPRMDGMTLLKEIKKIQPLAVVIVLTGFSSIEGAVNAIHAGAYQYLSKPVKAKELFEIVDKGLDYSEDLYGPLQKAFDPGTSGIDPAEPVMLHGFSVEDKADFMALGRVKQFQAGESIPVGDSKEGAIAVIESGEASVWMSNTTIDYLKKYDTWGEESIILTGSIPVNLRAEGTVVIRFFERKKILDYFSYKGEKLLKRFIINISSGVFVKWRKAIQRIVMLKLVTNND